MKTRLRQDGGRYQHGPPGLRALMEKDQGLIVAAGSSEGRTSALKKMRSFMEKQERLIQAITKNLVGCC